MTKEIQQTITIDDGYKAIATIYTDGTAKVDEKDLGLTLFFNSREKLEQHIKDHLWWCNLEVEKQIEETRLGWSSEPPIYLMGDEMKY